MLIRLIVVVAFTVLGCCSAAAQSRDRPLPVDMSVLFGLLHAGPQQSADVDATEEALVEGEAVALPEVTALSICFPAMFVGIARRTRT